MKKRIAITIGSLLAVSLPVTATVSCGTSWHKWGHASSYDPASLTQDPTKSNIESNNPNKPKESNTSKNENVVTTKDLFAIRPIADLKKLAYDESTSTIDLTKVNNQFELNALLVNIVQLKSPKSIENYWRSTSWTEFASFVSQVVETKEINIKYTDSQNVEHKTIAKWDISASKQKIIDGLKDTTHYVDIEADEQKYFNAAKNELTEDGLFILAKAKAVVDLINLPIVSALTNVSLDYASNKLALLVNLPTPAFNAFKGLLSDIGKFTGPLFKVDKDNNYIFENETIKYWISQKHLKPNIVISDIDNKARYPEGLIEGAFLLQAVSTEYDELGK